jgi:hypothetical protein
MYLKLGNLMFTAGSIYYVLHFVFIKSKVYRATELYYEGVVSAATDVNPSGPSFPPFFSLVSCGT